MLAGLGSYPDVVPSSIPWAPKLPSTWGVARGKALFQKVDRPVRPGDGIVTCFRDGVVTLRSRRRTTGFTESLKEIGYQGVRKRDLVIHAMDAFAGAVGVSDSDGKSTPVYSVCVPRGDADPYYYAAAIREMARCNWIMALSRGIRERSTDFRFEMFGTQLFPVPPVDEQNAIVRFLAHANNRVDTAIAAKSRLAKLLQQQKDAIRSSVVHDAVAAAPTRVMSGYDWLGDVPSSWVKYRAKAVLADIDVRSMTGREEVLSVSHITGVTPRSEKQITMFEAASYVGHKLCRPGDLVVNTMWAWMGALGVSRLDGIVSPAYNVYRPRIEGQIDPDFLAYLLKSQQYNDMFRMYSTGIRPSRLRFYPDQMLALPLFLPSLGEQRRIVQRILDASAQVDRAVLRVKREIDLLREFRARLVADVVTGKVDVRQVASSLPQIESTSDWVESESIDDMADVGEEELS